MGYEDIYEKRLNRYGLNYQERVMTQRRLSFKKRLLASVYRVDFSYEGQVYEGTFERYKQDNTEIFRYLFTDYDVIFPNGAVLMLPDPIGLYESKSDKVLDDRSYPEGAERPWMVFYLEDTGAKGYNRYIMLKMTHWLEWLDRDKQQRTSWAYMYGQEDNMLKDEIRSRSRMDTFYAENLKSSFFIMPATPYIRKDDYLIIDKDKNKKVLEEYYRVTGYDIQSQDGVEYVTVDPIYEYAKDFYQDVEPGVGENVDDYFWLGNIGELKED